MIDSQIPILDATSSEDVSTLVKYIRSDAINHKLVFTVDYDDTIAEKTNTFTSRVMLWWLLSNTPTASMYIITSRHSQHININEDNPHYNSEFDNMCDWCSQHSISPKAIISNAGTKATIINTYIQTYTPHFVCHFDDDMTVIQACVELDIPVMYPAEMLCKCHREKWKYCLEHMGSYEAYEKFAPHKLNPFKNMDI